MPISDYGSVLWQVLVLHSLIARPAAADNQRKFKPAVSEFGFGGISNAGQPQLLSNLRYVGNLFYQNYVVTRKISFRQQHSFSFALFCCLCYFQVVILSKTAFAVEKCDLELVLAKRIMSNPTFGREKSKCKQVNLFFVEVN